MQHLESTVVQHKGRMDAHKQTLDKHHNQLTLLTENKVNVKDDKQHRRALEKRMKRIDESHDEIRNQ